MWSPGRFVFSDDGVVALDWMAMSAALALLGAVGIQTMLTGAEAPVNALLSGLHPRAASVERAQMHTRPTTDTTAETIQGSHGGSARDCFECAATGDVERFDTTRCTARPVVTCSSAGH